MEDRHAATVATPPVEVWPPDDTEESVVGTNLHQENIRYLCSGLNEVAAGAAPVGQPPRWQALSQTGLSGLQHPDGSPYKVLPDVFVYDHPIDALRATLSVLEEGPPLLIVEVLSPDTYRSDLDFRKGKGYSYARADVPEYLVLDATGEFGRERLRGWRLEGSTYRPVPADRDGRWHSQAIEAAVALEGVRAVVYDRDGRRMLREGEVARELARRDRELARQAEEIAALRRRLEELGKGE